MPRSSGEMLGLGLLICRKGFVLYIYWMAELRGGVHIICERDNRGEGTNGLTLTG